MAAQPDHSRLNVPVTAPALAEGIRYLYEHQYPHGEFCVYFAGDDPIQGWSMPGATIFPTALVANCLLPLAADAHVQAVCQRGLVLEKGQVAFQGGATEALDHYFNQQLTVNRSAATPPGTGPMPSQERPVVIQQLTVTSNAAKIRPDDEVWISLTYHALIPIEEASWSFRLYTHDGNVCITGARQTQAVTLQPRVHTLRCHVPRLPLLAGQYQVRAVIFEQKRLHPLAVWGWENPPTSLRVEVESSMVTNIDKILQQLVTIEVEWMS